MIESCWELKMWFIMHLCSFLTGTIVYLQWSCAGAGCLWVCSRQVRPCDVILTLDIGWRQTLDKTYVVGGRETIKDKFFVDSKYRFQNVVLYSLWRPGCSASAGNMICYNEWNKLKQECLPSLFKLNLYLAQSVSGGLIQRVTNIITTLNLNIRLFYFWKIWLGCRWWGVGCTVSGAGCGLAWSDLNVAARAGEVISPSRRQPTPWHHIVAAPATTRHCVLPPHYCEGSGAAQLVTHF